MRQNLFRALAALTLGASLLLAASPSPHDPSEHAHPKIIHPFHEPSFVNRQ
jgi:hypothetical protein